MFQEPQKYYQAVFNINGKIGTLRVGGNNTPDEARELCEVLVQEWRRDGTKVDLLKIKEETDMFMYDPDNGKMMCLICGNIQTYPKDGWICKNCNIRFR